MQPKTLISNQRLWMSHLRLTVIYSRLSLLCTILRSTWNISFSLKNHYVISKTLRASAFSPRVFNYLHSAWTLSSKVLITSDLALFYSLLHGVFSERLSALTAGYQGTKTRPYCYYRVFVRLLSFWPDIKYITICVYENKELITQTRCSLNMKSFERVHEVREYSNRY